jgi:hypothetical protein
LFSDFLRQEGSHSCHVVTKHGISQGIFWHTNIHKHMLRGLATEKSYATDCNASVLLTEHTRLAQFILCSYTAPSPPFVPLLYKICSHSVPVDARILQ